MLQFCIFTLLRNYLVLYISNCYINSIWSFVTKFFYFLTKVHTCLFNIFILCVLMFATFFYSLSAPENPLPSTFSWLVSVTFVLILLKLGEIFILISPIYHFFLEETFPNVAHSLLQYRIFLLFFFSLSSANSCLCHFFLQCPLSY